MTNTCFIFAMEEEINLSELIANNHISLIQEKSFKIFKFNQINNQYLIFSSIGMINSACATQYMIDKYQITKFINLGCAGTTNNSFKPLDFVVINNSYYGDSDLTAFGYQPNQMARQPECFHSNDLLNKQISLICTKNNWTFTFGSCGTINSFINKTNQHNFQNLLIQNFSCTEMELVGIAQTCLQNNVSWSSLKIISDSVLEPSLSSEQFHLNLNKIANYLTQIVLEWSN